MCVTNCILSQLDTPSVLLSISEDIWSAYLKQLYHQNHHRHEICASRDWLHDSNANTYRGLLDRLIRGDVHGLVALLEREVGVVQQRRTRDFHNALIGSALDREQLALSRLEMKSEPEAHIPVGTTELLQMRRLLNRVSIGEGSFASDTTADETDNVNDHVLIRPKALASQKNVIDPACSTAGRSVQFHVAPARDKGNNSPIRERVGRGVPVSTRLPVVDVTAALKQLVSLLGREQNGSSVDINGLNSTDSAILKEKLIRSRPPTSKLSSPDSRHDDFFQFNNTDRPVSVPRPVRGNLRSTDPALNPHLPEIDLTQHVFDTLVAVFDNTVSLNDCILPRVDLILILWMNTFTPLLPATTENKTKYLLHHSSMDTAKSRNKLVIEHPPQDTTSDHFTEQQQRQEGDGIAEGDDIIEERCMQEHKLRVGSLLNLHLILHSVLPQLTLQGVPSSDIPLATPPDTYHHLPGCIPLLPEFRLVMAVWPISAKSRSSNGRLSQWSTCDMMTFLDSYGVYLSLDLVVTVACQRGAVMGWNSTAVSFETSAVTGDRKEKALHELLHKTAALFVGMHVHHHHRITRSHRQHGQRMHVDAPDMFGYGYQERGQKKVKMPRDTCLASSALKDTTTIVHHLPSEHPENVTMALHSITHLLQDGSYSAADCTHMVRLCAARYPHIQPWAILSVLQASPRHSMTSETARDTSSDDAGDYNDGRSDNYLGLNLRGVKVLQEYYSILLSRDNDKCCFTSLQHPVDKEENGGAIDQALVHNWLDICLYLASEEATATAGDCAADIKYLEIVHKILSSHEGGDISAGGRKVDTFTCSEDVAARLSALYGYDVEEKRRKKLDTTNKDDISENGSDDEDAAGHPVGSEEEILKLFSIA